MFNNPTLGSTALRSEFSNSPTLLPKVGILSFISELGLSVNDLKASDIPTLVVARNARDLIVTFKLPAARENTVTNSDTLSEPEAGLKEKDLNLGFIRRDSDTPSDNFEIRRADGPEDLPFLLPEQFLFPDRQFYMELAEGTLLRYQAIDDDESDRDPSTTKRSLEQSGANPSYETMHGYVLLDTSRSMRGEHEGFSPEPDPRGIIARGTAIAFLNHVKTNHYFAHLRPFSDKEFDTITLDGCDAKASLRSIITKILTVPNEGGTRLQAALERAVQDIQKGGAYTGATILLITDGIAPLTKNPLGNIDLHTIFVGRFNPTIGSEQAAMADKLKSWSKSAQTFWMEQEASLLKVSNMDLSELSSAILAGIRKEIPFIQSEDEVLAMRQKLDLVNEAVKLYSKQDSCDRNELKKIQSEISELSDALKSAHIDQESLQLNSSYNKPISAQGIDSGVDPTAETTKANQKIDGMGNDDNESTTSLRMRGSRGGKALGSSSLRSVLRAAYRFLTETAYRVSEWVKRKS